MTLQVEGGTQIWYEQGEGVPLEPQNPYPYLRVILAEKGTHFYGFFFSKHRPIVHNFWVFSKFWKSGPMCTYIFVENGTHVLGFLVKKQPIIVAHPCMPYYVSSLRVLRPDAVIVRTNA